VVPRRKSLIPAGRKPTQRRPTRLEKRLHRLYKSLVEFRILGPLEMLDARGTVELRAAKPRTVLGVLLLHPNRVVSQARLAEELWGERTPVSSAKLVQTYVGKLRSALRSAVIETRPPGYLIRVDEQALDVLRFRRLVGEARELRTHGDPTTAAGLYCDALSLWRGSALADLSFESLASSEVDRLEEERLLALMDRIDCELLLGHDDELIPELETLVREFPLRERPRAQLMLAFYRSGRQADALMLYSETRRLLREELGLAPSPALQSLEREILRHDPKLDPAAKDPPDESEPRNPELRLPRSTYSKLLSDLAKELGELGRADQYAAAVVRRMRDAND
jgi:DNA-binding SARP family transcriptional activator